MTVLWVSRVEHDVHTSLIDGIKYKLYFTSIVCTRELCTP